MGKLEGRLREAIKHFWNTRDTQATRQGTGTGAKDQGARSAVTGGKQMDGFVNLICTLLREVGIEHACVHCERYLEIPGFFRPEKRWDLIVVVDETLLAGIEFKSQIGPSFGNNFNNRTEEALGSATDLWAAYREGAFKQSQRPWLGYLMLLEESPRSTSPVVVREPHFPVFEEFRGTSYAKRYEILLTKLVRERLYDSACFLLSQKDRGKKGYFFEPSAELSFQNFVASLLAKAIAYVKSKE
jgi:hypothetical protein